MRKVKRKRKECPLECEWSHTGYCPAYYLQNDNGVLKMRPKKNAPCYNEIKGDKFINI